MILNSKFKILIENNSHNTYCYEVHMNKPFITYTAQVEKLTNEKHLIVTDTNYAITSLKNISYYGLIGGYKHPFIDIHTRKYVNNTCFEDIVSLYELDEERIQEESMYDGFYAVVTNLEGDIREIININKRRWEIEENFRIMKTEFEARPVFVRREDSIKAHFLTCYISLLVYRLLEKKLLEEFTCSEILKTLREMNMTLLSKDSGYIPSYKRTKLTDALHTAFGFRTDYEFISKADMRTIIKETKQKK